MNILISGDSWGCGEWGTVDGKYQVLHLGLEQYLKDSGYAVKNISVGGASNKHSISLLTRELLFKKYDLILWFQTSPLRDLRPYKAFKKDYKSYDDLLTVSKQLLENSYSQLNKLNSAIHCIGGCIELDLELISEYKNLVPIVPSVTKLILNDYTHPALWIDEWREQIGSQFDLDTLDKFIEIDKLTDQLHCIEEYKKYFFPDGRHPNRTGHKLLFNFIAEQLSL